MQRFSDWRSRLSDVVSEWEGRAFIWGISDCACFAAECVRAMTGADAMATWREAYSSRLTAFARLKGRSLRSVGEAAGGALEALGAVRIPPELAKVGDVGVTKEDVLCVRLGRGFVARDPSGSYRLVKAAIAWRVG